MLVLCLTREELTLDDFTSKSVCCNFPPEDSRRDQPVDCGQMTTVCAFFVLSVLSYRHL